MVDLAGGLFGDALLGVAQPIVGHQVSIVSASVASSRIWASAHASDHVLHNQPTPGDGPRTAHRAAGFAAI